MQRVLVTRPEPGASKTAQKLRQMGLEPLVLPLTRIEALPAELAIDPLAFAAIAVVSSNAARHAPASLIQSLSGLPAYAVGATTAAVSRAIGLNVVDNSAGDAAGLQWVIMDKVEPRSRILVLCGRVRRDILEQGLRDSGFVPHFVEVYDTLPNPPSARETAIVLGNMPVDIVLFYSAFAADEFTRLMETMGGLKAFEGARFIAISERIRSHLPESLRDCLIIAAEPNEEAMLSLL